MYDVNEETREETLVNRASTVFSQVRPSYGKMPHMARLTYCRLDLASDKILLPMINMLYWHDRCLKFIGYSDAIRYSTCRSNWSSLMLPRNASHPNLLTAA